MKNNKGQALVEFIAILPIFLLLIVILYDIANIFYNKTNVLNDLSLIKDLYQQKDMKEINEYITLKDYEIEYKTNNNLVTIKLKKEIETIGSILENPFVIEEEITLVEEG